MRYNTKCPETLQLSAVQRHRAPSLSVVNIKLQTSHSDCRLPLHRLHEFSARSPADWPGWTGPSSPGAQWKKKKKGLQRCKLKWSLWSVFLVKSSSFAPARSGVDDFGVSDINNHQLSATDVVSWNLFNGHFVQHSTRLVPGGDLIKVL